MMTGSTQTNFDPRPYQDECVQAMLHYTGHAAITSLAVGLGKTKITTDFARAIVKRGGRVLLLAHREELVRNPVDNYLSDIRCGIERGTEHARRDEPIISASVQSLSGARLNNTHTIILLTSALTKPTTPYAAVTVRSLIIFRAISCSARPPHATVTMDRRWDRFLTMYCLSGISVSGLLTVTSATLTANGYSCNTISDRYTSAKEILSKRSLSRRFPAPPKVLPRSTSVTLWVKPSFSACLPQKRKPPQTALTAGTGPLQAPFSAPRKTVQRFCKILPPERSKCLPLIRY